MIENKFGKNNINHFSGFMFSLFTDRKLSFPGPVNRLSVFDETVQTLTSQTLLFCSADHSISRILE